MYFKKVTFLMYPAASGILAYERWLILWVKNGDTIKTDAVTNTYNKGCSNNSSSLINYTNTEVRERCSYFFRILRKNTEKSVTETKWHSLFLLNFCFIPHASEVYFSIHHLSSLIIDALSGVISPVHFLVHRVFPGVIRLVHRLPNR